MKDEYQIFCESAPDMPVFSMPWWLDAVCGKDGWDVILVKRNKEIVASFPYHIRKKIGMRFLTMPPLTQKLGVYIKYPESQTKTVRLSYEKDIMTEIISRLPNHDFFRARFDHRYTNWLPFYWQGFSQTTRYTYILENIKDYDHVYAKYNIQKIQKIQKAQKILSFQVDLPKEEFFSYFSESVEQRGDKANFSKEQFYRIYDALYEHNSGRIFYCIDKEKNIHAISLIIWDKECAYYLVAMRKKEYNTSGGTEFLVDETIKYVSQFVNKFDFEGSMIEEVENSFRKFGAVQTPYFQITKNKSKHFIILNGLKDIWDGIKQSSIKNQK